MSTATLVNALALPLDARLDQRVPKKLLLEQGAPTAPTSGACETVLRKWSGSRR